MSIFRPTLVHGRDHEYQALYELQELRRQLSELQGRLAEQDPLSVREIECLTALVELKAFSVDTRRKGSRVARKAYGQDAEPDRVKAPLARLARRGLVDSLTGKGGGSWLTPAGRIFLGKEPAEESVITVRT